MTEFKDKSLQYLIRNSQILKVLKTKVKKISLWRQVHSETQTGLPWGCCSPVCTSLCVIPGRVTAETFVCLMMGCLLPTITRGVT